MNIFECQRCLPEFRLPDHDLTYDNSTSHNFSFNPLKEAHINRERAPLPSSDRACRQLLYSSALKAHMVSVILASEIRFLGTFIWLTKELLLSCISVGLMVFVFLQRDIQPLMQVFSRHRQQGY